MGANYHTSRLEETYMAFPRMVASYQPDQKSIPGDAQFCPDQVLGN
jgi:hypothetical protein